MSGAQTDPHPVDRHVGRLIRLRRRALGMSQTALAAALGISFQQVQKYERGRNRVSASTLHALAAALEVGVADFFEGLPAAAGGARAAALDPSRGLVAEMLCAPGGPELAAAWLAVPPGPVRNRLTALVLAVGDGTG